MAVTPWGAIRRPLQGYQPPTITGNALPPPSGKGGNVSPSGPQAPIPYTMPVRGGATAQPQQPYINPTPQVTPSWVSAYGQNKEPWRNIPSKAMQFPYMRFLTGQSPLNAWSGPNVPLASAWAWNQMAPRERETLQGTVIGAGMTWEDYLARLGQLNPTWTSPGRAAWAYR